jgi:hypothetical protein
MQNERTIQKMQAKVEKKQNNTQKPKTHPPQSLPGTHSHNLSQILYSMRL